MQFRKATRKDVAAIVRLLADDELGAQRETVSEPLPQQYYTAFDRIDVDPYQELVVVEDGNGQLIGTLQLSHIQYLSYQGGSRMQIESVHIASGSRGQGIGKQLFTWAINRAREKGARLVQLTTDKRRPDAKRFYERLGFKASHEGMKLHL
ncbi:MAG: GNAT family N-acetyltransferase [Candidatus Pseudobacter hemicellulosilyticus]|uniref:GNAT family N-acetyltransferase n=1 Tax=Candidatus Pseudobacter hemicellulosilyticus TaxID=3121375 RepID=A0AAJ6BFQ0_9BACT|nr:MAG: GNAT family N-acetyltransferase [Pseudobacter sp.]